MLKAEAAMPSERKNAGTTRPPRVLSDTVKGCLESFCTVEPFVFRQRTSLGRFGEKIDEAFAGRPLLATESATSRSNLRRFSKYCKLLRALLALNEQVHDLWAQLHGIGPTMTAVYIEMLCWQAKAELKAGRVKGGVLSFAGPGAEIFPPTTKQGWRVWKEQVKKRLAVGLRPKQPGA